MQLAYERGRMQATLAKAATARPLTLWRNDELLWAPLERAVGRRVACEIELETRVARTHRVRTLSTTTE